MMASPAVGPSGNALMPLGQVFLGTAAALVFSTIAIYFYFRKLRVALGAERMSLLRLTVASGFVVSING